MVAPVALPLKLTVVPWQTGLGVAVAVTAVGASFTVSVTVAPTLPQVLVASNVYGPLAFACALAIDGFCCEDIKLFGPLHPHDVAPVALPVNNTVCPAHAGLGLADAVTFWGMLLTVMLTVAVAVPQLLLAVSV